MLTLGIYGMVNNLQDMVALAITNAGQVNGKNIGANKWN